MLSIIIPTKNEEKYLPKLLDSIKTQSFTDWEIIVADAGSTDRTIKIAKSYNCKIVKGGLPAKGRNQGAKYSKGQNLLFIDSDIILPKNFLKNAIEEFEKKTLDIAGTLQVPIPTMKKSKDLEYTFFYEIINTGMKLIQNSKKPAMQVCMFVKREIHEKIKGFDETLIFGEDSEYARRAVKIGKFGILKSEKVMISPRRFEKEGVILVLKNLYFIIGIIFGHKFEKNSKIKYFNNIQKD